MSQTRFLTDRVRALLGLTVRPEQSGQLEGALKRLCEEHRLTSEQMVLRLQHDREMLRELVSAITVSETYFFRHKEHLEHLVATVRRHQGGNPFRVLSAGCATGAEPYSLAIAVREAGLDPARIEIVACDVSRTAIEQARVGSYNDWVFRKTPQPIRGRYFRRSPVGGWRLAAEVRSSVTFHLSSIQDHLRFAAPRSYDAILCRNVTVYFAPEAYAELYASMARALRADGKLLIAPTDPRPSTAWFVRTSDKEATIFGPVGAASRLPPATHSSKAPRQKLPPPPPLRCAPNDADLDEIRALADSGEHAEALRRLEPICGARPGEARLHLFRGQLFLAAERWQDAVAALGQGLRADPVNPLARYWYALALRDAGRHDEALAEANALSHSLERPSVRVQDGETTAQEMYQAVQQLKEELR